MSLAGTNLSNELPLRVHQSTVRSRCAVARTHFDLHGSWSQHTSEIGGPTSPWTWSWKCPPHPGPLPPEGGEGDCSFSVHGPDARANANGGYHAFRTKPHPPL